MNTTITMQPIGPDPSVLHLTDDDKRWISAGTISTNTYEDICKMSHFLLSQAVYKSTHLLANCAKLPGIKHEHFAPILILRRAIELCDAISILMRFSLSEPYGILHRSLIELYFSLAFICQGNKIVSERSLAFLVWTYHDMIKDCLLVDNSTEKGGAFQKTISECSLLKTLSSIAANTKDMLDSIGKILAQPDLSSLSAKYKELEHKKNNIHWYQLCNVPNIRELSKKTGLEGVYIVFYSSYSASVHGTDIHKHGIDYGNGNPMLWCIRKSDLQVHQCASLVIGWLVKMSLDIAQCILPQPHAYLLDLNKWFQSIKPALDNINGISITYSTDNSQ